jgi:chromosome segregation ATPase
VGKKRAQSEVETRKTIQKLIAQRDEARKRLEEALGGGQYILKSEHHAALDTVSAHQAEMGKLHAGEVATLARELREVQKSLRDGNAAVYAELDATRELLRLEGEIRQQHSEIIGGLKKSLEEKTAEVASLEKTLAEHGARVLALTSELSGTSATENKKLRKRIHTKTLFVEEQQRYIGHLTSTIRHLLSLPMVQDYLAQVQRAAREEAELRAAGAPGVPNMSATATAVLNAEAQLAKAPVDSSEAA